MTKATQRDAKRLRKSVKRRRGYAENLRNSVATMRAAAQASGSREDEAFADRLDELANAELATARDEEAQAREVESRLRGGGSASASFSSTEQRERSERAMAAMSGSFTRDRIEHLLAHHGLGRTGNNHDDLQEIERRLDLTEQVNPKGGPRMQVGRRVILAETATFGVPRF